MKKLLLLALVLLGGITQVSATWYVIGDVAGGWVADPITKGKVLAMTQSSTDANIYYCDIAQPTSSAYFVIVDGEGTNDDDWPGLAAHKYANNNNIQDVSGFSYNIELAKGIDKAFHITDADGSKSYRIVFNALTSKMSVVQKGLTRNVAGCFTPEGGEDGASFFTNAFSPTETANNMAIQEDGSYAITYNNVDLTAGDIRFKLNDGSWTNATSSDQHRTIGKAATFNITFTMPYANNFEDYTCKAIETTLKYYLVGSESEWRPGDELNHSSGDMYYKVFSNKTGCEFIISPNTNLNGLYDVISWDDCIRPAETTSIAFANYNDTDPCTETGKNYKWIVNNNGLSDVRFSYDADENKWSVSTDPVLLTIGAACYATYSMGDKFKVNSAEKVYTVSNNNITSVTLEEWDGDTVFPENTGVIIKVQEDGATVNIVPVDVNTAVTTLGENLLVGSGNSPLDITADDGIYIFNWNGSDPSTVGFYKASDGTLKAHKAYLNLNGTSTPARDFLGFDFDGGATSIDAIKEVKMDGEVFNLAGQRVAQPTKGLYIVNGKKVIIK